MLTPAFQSRGRGFTLAELTIGMSITTVVLAAVMSFTMSVAQSWKANLDDESAASIANVATARVSSVLRPAALAGACRAGSLDNTSDTSAALLYWRADRNDDRKIQRSELEALQFDPDTKTLCRYTVPGDFTDEEITGAQLLDDVTIDETIKYFDRIPLSGKITGMRISHRDDGSKRPVIEVQIRIDRGGRKHMHSVTVNMRNAAAVPN